MPLHFGLFSTRKSYIGAAIYVEFHAFQGQFQSTFPHLLLQFFGFFNFQQFFSTKMTQMYSNVGLWVNKTWDCYSQRNMLR